MYEKKKNQKSNIGISIQDLCSSVCRVAVMTARGVLRCDSLSFAPGCFLIFVLADPLKLGQLVSERFDFVYIISMTPF